MLHVFRTCLHLSRLPVIHRLLIEPRRTLLDRLRQCAGPVNRNDAPAWIVEITLHSNEPIPLRVHHYVIDLSETSPLCLGSQGGRTTIEFTVATEGLRGHPFHRALCFQKEGVLGVRPFR